MKPAILSFYEEIYAYTCKYERTELKKIISLVFFRGKERNTLLLLIM